MTTSANPPSPSAGSPVSGAELGGSNAATARRIARRRGRGQTPVWPASSVGITLHPGGRPPGFAAAPFLPSSAPPSPFQRGSRPAPFAARLVGPSRDADTARRRIGRRPAVGLRQRARSSARPRCGLAPPAVPFPGTPSSIAASVTLRDSPQRFATRWNQQKAGKRRLASCSGRPTRPMEAADAGQGLWYTPAHVRAETPASH